jgi:lipopolysaccharide export system protein LptA
MVGRHHPGIYRLVTSGRSPLTIQSDSSSGIPNKFPIMFKKQVKIEIAKIVIQSRTLSRFTTKPLDQKRSMGRNAIAFIP